MRIVINKQSFGFTLSEYILALALILQGQSIWMTIDGLHFPYIVSIVAVLGLLGCCAYSPSNNSNWKKSTNGLVILVLYLFIYILLRPVNIIAYVRSVIVVILLYVYAARHNTFSKPTLFLKYSNLMYVIACISLFFYIFGSLLHIIPVTGYVTSGWMGHPVQVPTYFGLYYVTQTDHWEFIRNCGIFAETPLFSFHLCTALIVELTFKEKPKKVKTLVFLISVITTRSTTGYVFLLGVIFYKLYIRNKANRIWKLIPYMLAIFIVPIILSTAYDLYIQKSISASGSIRFNDFLVGIMAWRAHPILGGGFGNLNYIQSFMGGWRSWNTGFSNSLTHILATGGLYLSVLYYGAFIKGIIKAIHIKSIDIFFFVIMMLYLFVFTIVTNTFVIYYLLIWMAIVDYSRNDLIVSTDL